MSRLILASASPRRQQLLRDAGYAFDVQPADIDEENFPRNLLPPDVAEYLAAAKAQAVSAEFPDDVVLAADTVVSFGDMLLGKPSDPAHARQMLDLLSGTTHLCITGVSVIHRAANFAKKIRVMSAVRMRNLTPAEIDRYVASNAWQGKAGGYGIQDDDPFVTRQSGSRSNIVGLPMAATKALLLEAGIEPRGPSQAG
ncbi:MAG: Maf family protein [Tepidisphaeraceae bacterium]